MQGDTVPQAWGSAPRTPCCTAYDESAKGNQTTSAIGKAIKRDEARIEGLSAATTAVVIQAGARNSRGTQDHATSDARVSTLTAGGNLTILATDGSITSQGSTMSAEGNALLIAKDNITFDVDRQDSLFRSTPSASRIACRHAIATSETY